MKLLINGLSARLGGGQTYLYQLLRHLPAQWQITLISSGGLMQEHIPAQVRHITLPALVNPFRRAWWERTKLPAFAEERGCEVIFNPACLLPPMHSTKLKTAVTFQNMLPFDAAQRRAYPLFSYRYLRDRLLERGLMSAMKRADLVIFISQFAHDFIVQQKHIQPRHSVVIPHGIEERFFTATDLPHDSALQNAPYFLYVSYLDYYKCQREVVQAYAALRAKHKLQQKLVLVGTGYERYVSLVKQDIQALGLQNEVILLGNVPHETLPALYQNATLNLFASTCENCPNILLEIMASGATALVSNYEPMPEVAGDTVTYFDPRNHQKFITTWESAIQSINAAKTNAARAKERAGNHRWESAIAHTSQALQSLVSGT